jgi:hypothetical protein
MSDTTPNEGNTNPETDAAVSTPEAGAPEPGAPEDTGFDTAANAPADAAQAEPADYSAPSEYTDAPGYTGTGSHSAIVAEPAAAPAAEPEAVAAYEPAAAVAPEPMQRPYVSAATIVAPAATAVAPAAAAPATASAAPLAGDYAPTEQYPAPVQPAATPIYVQAPTPPRNRGNRGAGIGIALLATVVYAALYALVAFIIVGLGSSTFSDTTEKFAEFVVRPVFYVPVIFFFLALALLVALVNRGGWWAYVLFGFLVAAVVYFSYVGGALLTVQAWNLTPEAAAAFLARQWLNPGTIASAVIAREVTIWAGAWISRHGRRVAARNVEARQDYERQLAEGPQLSR